MEKRKNPSKSLYRGVSLFSKGKFLRYKKKYSNKSGIKTEARNSMGYEYEYCIYKILASY